MDGLNWARSTAIRAMKTLEILGLVDLTEEPIQTNGGQQTGYVMKLKESFKWFQSSDFQKLWRLKPKQTKQPKLVQSDIEQNLPFGACSSAHTNGDQGAAQ